MSTPKPSNTPFFGPHCDILYAVLDRRGWSIKTMATESGLDDSRLSKIMKGTQPFTLHQLERLVGASLLTASEAARCRKVATAQALRVSRGAASAGPSDDDADVELAPEERRRLTAATKRLDRDEVRSVRKGRFFVTAVMQGAPARVGALAAIEVFKKERKAKPIFLPLRAHLKPLSDKEYPLDDSILEGHWKDVYRSVQFNEHLTAADLDLRPYRADPLIGLAPYGAKDGHSFLFAHTTQRAQFHPNPKGKHPRVQYCTGCVTEPLYIATTSGEMAFDRHVMGGLVVEIDADRFHVRQIQFDEAGGFYDFADGVPAYYGPDGMQVDVRASLLGRGDDHGGPSVWGDETACKAIDVLTNEVRPRVVTVEDLFDGASINPHALRSLSQQLATPVGAPTLLAEGKATALHLRRIWDSMPNDARLVVKASNHHRFLNRYLDEARWVKDPNNYKTALGLAAAYHLEGKDPVQVLVDPGDEWADWLKQDESFVVEGIEYGSHLDEGTNGGPASNRSHAAAHGRAGGGHVHAPQILWGIIRTGTMAKLKQGYNTGPSSWAHAVELCWPGGMRQLVVVIDGRYRL